MLRRTKLLDDFEREQLRQPSEQPLLESWREVTREG